MWYYKTALPGNHCGLDELVAVWDGAIFVPDSTFAGHHVTVWHDRRVSASSLQSADPTKEVFLRMTFEPTGTHLLSLPSNVPFRKHVLRRRGVTENFQGYVPDDQRTMNGRWAMLTVRKSVW